MTSTTTSRRQRTKSSTAFSSSSSIGSFLSREVKISSRSICSEGPCVVEESLPHWSIPKSVVSTRVKRAPDPTPSLPSFDSAVTVVPPPAAAPSRQAPGRYSRYSRPVPPPKPHEILPRRRGRNSRRRAIEGEHFRRYIYLRRQLKPWSDAFVEKHGRTPSLTDVHDSNVPGLLDRFVEYLEARDGLWDPKN